MADGGEISLYMGITEPKTSDMGKVSKICIVPGSELWGIQLYSN